MLEYRINLEEGRLEGSLSPNTWRELEPGGDGLSWHDNSLKLHLEWLGLDLKENWFIEKQRNFGKGCLGK